MKLFYLSISIVFLFFTGCSTTYKVTDDNRTELYKEFNSSAANTKVEVDLKTDSLVIVPGGAEIKDDSIIINYPVYYPLKLKKNFSLAEVNQASYKNHWKSAPYGTFIGLMGGIFVGGITSAYILNLKSGGNHPDRDYGTGAGVGLIIGIVLGTIVGLIVGWNNIYQFGP